jgi:hypothetical protein
MVDQEARTYRPRRAFIESDGQSAEPDMPAKSYREHARPITPRVDEDRPKPLYRDELRTNGGSSPASRAFPIAETDPPTDETLRPITFTPRRTRGADDETTTILPRSRAGQPPTQPPLDAIDDYDEDERKPLSQRAKLALLIGAVAAVAVIGLLIGYAVLAAGKQPQSQPSVAPPAGANGTSSTSGNASQAPAQTGAAPLTDASMLSPDQAKVIDRDRTWKVTSTEHSPSEDAPAAACFGGEPPQGQLTPQQRILRVLNSSGKKAPVALHEATAYNTADEAVQAYTIASKTIGGCAVTGSYIESGHTVSGVGNQAAGVVVIDVSKHQAHSVILNRTGRVVNIIDASQPSKALAITAVAKALGQVNSVQCAPAGGECNGTARVKDGPPPLGGDKPGFLATGDLPPAKAKVGPWVPTGIEQPKAGFKGSQCETVNWATVAAKSKNARQYLYSASGNNNFFGLDEIVLKTKDAKAANKLVDQIKSDLTSCKRPRVLTASVTKPKKVTSVGAQKTKIAGWTAVVLQNTPGVTAKYRVGIVAAGPKVIYTFGNPSSDYDVTGDQWDTVAVRAGERATQVD